MNDKIIMFDESCWLNCTKVFNAELIRHGRTIMHDYNLPIEKDEGHLEIRFIYKLNMEYLEQIIYKRDESGIKYMARLYQLKGDKYKFLRYINPQKMNWEDDFDKIFNLPLKRRLFGPITWR